MINTKPLMKFLLWTFTLFLVCIVGISKVFGATISDYATKYYYYNANDNSSTKSTEYRTGDNNFVTLFGAEPPTYDNGEGFNGFYNRINYSIVKGNIYTLNLVLSYSNLQDTEFSSNDVNNRLLNTNFAHCSDCSISSVSGFLRRYNASAPAGSNLYDFTVSISYTFVSTSTTNQWYIGTYTGDDRVLGVDNHLYTSIVRVTGLTIEENNSSTIINQNDTIINQNNQIIEQNNQNTQDIINNNDTNTNKIIDENKKNFQECSKNINFELKKGKHFNTNGTLSNSADYYYTDDFIKVERNKIIIITSSSGSNPGRLMYYNSNKVLIDWYTAYSRTLTLTEDTEYIRFSTLDPNIKLEYEEEVCTNKLDEQKNAINNVDNTLKDDSVDDNGIADAFDDFNDFLDDNSTITQLITLPITLYTAILNNLNGTCSPFNLGELYGESLILPCINISQYLGNSLWTMIDIIISGFAVYAISKKMIKVFNNFSSLREGDVIDD